MIDLTDRVVLITGAAGGIGAATARTVVAAGGYVSCTTCGPTGAWARWRTSWASARTPSPPTSPTRAAPRRCGGRRSTWRGRVDVLVNNAGIYEPADPDGDLEAWTAAWERTLAVCLTTPATLCREAIRTFRAQDGGGIVVNLASRAAFRGEDPEYWHYAAAKAGVVADHTRRSRASTAATA